MKIISVMNQKGGVGKTTTALALAEGLVFENKRVLLIDFDHQDFICNLFNLTKKQNNAADWFMDKESIRNIVVSRNGLDIMSGGENLHVLNDFLQTERKNIKKIKEKLLLWNDKYDYIIIDTAPSLSFLTYAVLTATNEIIVPVNPNILSYYGALNMVDRYIESKKINKMLKINGFLITGFKKHNKKHNELLEKFKKDLFDANINLYKTTIRHSETPNTAFSLSKSIYYRKSGFADDYKNFIKEFLEGEK